MAQRLVRLTKRPEFLAVQNSGEKCVTPGFVLRVAPNPQRRDSRVGFTVTRKLGTAVVRNRIKRRLRAAVDDVLPGRIKGGYDLVFIGRSAAKDRPYDKLKQDVIVCLDKLGLGKS